jgi:hypothetical protein
MDTILLMDEPIAITTVVSLPRPWPFPHEHCLLNGSGVSIFVTPKGTLLFRGSKNGRVEFWESRPLAIVGDGYVTLRYKWTIGVGHILKLNNHDISEYESADQEAFSITTSVRPPQVTSYDHPTCLEACREWMTWREKLVVGSADPGSRLRTPQDESVNLEKRLVELQRQLDEYRKGNQLAFDTALSLLPSLIYFKKQHSKDYNPALLRVAAIKRMPLPVFTVPSPPAEIFDLMNTLVGGHEFGVKQTTSTQILVDFQAVLIEPCLKLPSASNRIMSLNELLGLIRNYESNHSSPSFPKVLDELNSITAIGKSMDRVVLERVIQATLDLGAFVLE